MIRRALIGATLVFGLLLVPRVATEAALANGTVHCGESITHSIVLHNDLINCPGKGLIVGADNVTVNLNGHLIDGSFPSQFPLLVPGIQIFRARGVTIENGRISGFGIGAESFESPRAHFHDLSLREDFLGVLVFMADNSRVEHDVVVGNDYQGIGGGIDVDFSRGVIVSDNHLEHGAGIEATGSAELQILRNTESDANAACAHVCDGIVLFDTAITRIANNSLRNNPNAGISLRSARDVTVAFNIVEQNGRDGVVVDDASQRDVVEHNHANHNREDGIKVQAPGARITSNVANFNDNIGIEAVAGVIDGGRNTAHGNLNSTQCTGVVCR